MLAADLIEVEFKGNRKVIYSNPNDLNVKVNDYVIVKANKGINIGKVNRLGRLVRMKDMEDDPEAIVRLATDEEVGNLPELQKKEIEMSIVCKQKIERLGLDMKLVDVERQFDGNKITFYFTSDKRVDFRELVKELANKYRVRIELRQIGVRDEARRISGCGKCGRTLCCSSFIKEFETITTQHAKDQNLPLNPGKLSGSCGRLMCCLSYERDYYQESLKKYPTLDTNITIPKFRGNVIKIDVFTENITLRSSDDEYLTVSLDDYNNYLKQKKVTINQHRTEKQYSN